MKINLPIIVIATLILGFALFFIGNTPFSIVGSSTLNYDSINNRWISTQIYVNGTDTLTLSNTSFEDNSIPNSDIQSASATKGFTFQTSQKTPYCSYNLSWDTYTIQSFLGLPINTIPYAKLTSKYLHAPYTIKVTQGTAIDSYDMDASISGLPTQNFFNGKVQVSNLGQLSNGIACPDSAGAVLLPDYDNSGSTITAWKLASASDFDSWKRVMYVDYASCLLNVSGCVSRVLNNMSQPAVAMPTSFAQFTSTNISSINNGATNLIGYLPLGSTSASIVLSVDGTFVNTIVVKKPNGTPKVELSINKTNLKQSESATLIAKITNIGTSSDNFRLIPQTSNVFNFNPIAQETGTINANSNVSKDFVVYALGSGTTNVCVTAQALGSGNTSNSCISVTSTPTTLPPEPPPQDIEICGNGVCNSSKGENYFTCSTDCGTPPSIAICGNGVCEGSEILSCSKDCSSPDKNVETFRESCLARPSDMWVVGWNYDAGIPLIKAESCNPVYNWGLIVLIFGFVVVIGVGFFILFNTKKRRR